MVRSNNAQVGTATDARIERYRRAERAFWDHYGLAPADRFVAAQASRSCSSMAPAAQAPTSPRWSASCKASGA